jgi:cell shape-determining protein MreC
MPSRLVDDEGPDDHGELGDGVASRQESPDARHQSHRNTVASIAAMSIYWLALAVALVVVIASAIFTTRKGLETFRAFKILGSTVTSEVERIERVSGEIERHLTLAAESASRLDAELEQLRRSRARLNVLTSAIDEVRASLDRVTAVYPRK